MRIESRGFCVGAGGSCDGVAAAGREIASSRVTMQHIASDPLVPGRAYKAYEIDLAFYQCDIWICGIGYDDRVRARR